MNTFFYDSYQLIFIFFLPGVFLGVVYDIFRILRISRTSDLPVSGTFYDKIRPQKPLCALLARFFQSKSLKTADRIFVFIEDILFWIIAAVTEILLIFHTNGGEIRIYCLLATIAGFFLYHETLGKVVAFFARQISFLLRCLIYWLLYDIIYPVKQLGKALYRFFVWGYQKTVGRYLVIKKEKKFRIYSEQIKNMMLTAAECGFSVYGKGDFGYEGENEYFC